MPFIGPIFGFQNIITLYLYSVHSGYASGTLRSKKFLSQIHELKLITGKSRATLEVGTLFSGKCTTYSFNP